MLALPSLLSALIWTPITGGVLILLTGNDKQPNRSRILALATSLLTIAFCIPLYLNFDTSTFAFQFRETLHWIPSYKIRYDIGVDGISMPLIILTVYTMLLVILSS